MTDENPVTELEVSCDIDGPEGPLPPIKFKLELSGDFKTGYIVGCLITTGILLGILTIV